MTNTEMKSKSDSSQKKGGIPEEMLYLLSDNIRSSLTRLDMLIYMGSREAAHEEIQSLASYLEDVGL